MVGTEQAGFLDLIGLDMEAKHNPQSNSKNGQKGKLTFHYDLAWLPPVNRGAAELYQGRGFPYVFNIQHDNHASRSKIIRDTEAHLQIKDILQIKGAEIYSLSYIISGCPYFQKS